MTIISLLSDLAMAVRSPMPELRLRHGPVETFPSPQTSSFKETPSDQVRTSALQSRLHDFFKKFGSENKLYDKNFVKGFNTLISGLKASNKKAIAEGTEEVLKMSAKTIAKGLDIANIPEGKEMIPGVGMLTAAFDLVDGIQWLYRVHGTYTAGKVIFAILALDPNVPNVPAQTTWTQSTADLKLRYFQTLNPMVAAICWAGYKYKPSWWVNARAVIERIGLPILGLAAAILAILVIGFSISTLGSVAILLGSLSTLTGFGVIIHRSGSYFLSRKVFNETVLPTLTENQKKEIDFCLNGTHVLFGATIGDYFRYLISLLLFEHWRLGRLDSPDLTNFPTSRPMGLSYAVQCIDCIYDVLPLAVWDTIVANIGRQKAASILIQSRTLYRSALNNTPNELNRARLSVIKLFFSVLLVR